MKLLHTLNSTGLVFWGGSYLYSEPQDFQTFLSKSVHGIHLVQGLLQAGHLFAISVPLKFTARKCQIAVHLPLSCCNVHLYLYYVLLYIYIIYTYTLSYVNDVTQNLMWARVLLETGDRWSLPVLFTSLVTCLARVAHFKEVNVSWGLDFWNFLFFWGEVR